MRYYNSLNNVELDNNSRECFKCSVNKICLFKYIYFKKTAQDLEQRYLNDYSNLYIKDSFFTKIQFNIIDNITYLFQSIVILIIEKWHQIAMDKSVNNLLSVIKGCCFNS